MFVGDRHLSDEELLLFADGELPSRRANQARRHLAACWECRARSSDLERTIADFVRAHHFSLDSQLPPVAGPRAQLKARLAESTAVPTRKGWPAFLGCSPSRQQWACFGMVLLLAAVGLWAGSHHADFNSQTASAQSISEALPNRALTPGITRPVTVEDACGAEDNDPVSLIPVSIKQQALRAYGIRDSQKGQYQLDYLIPPGLGGTADIRNLWPEPYTSTVWNAHVKDALENRLRNLVCQGQLDLPEAQHELATNWINAYQKYCHSDRVCRLCGGLAHVAMMEIDIY